MTTTTSDFIADPDVAHFIRWMTQRLPDWPVHLNLSHSPFAPGGVAAQVPFARLVPAHYRWRLAGMAVGDWWETLDNLKGLARPLRAAVWRNDASATRAACEAIALWGADRNSRVGATAFLISLGTDLPAYLRRVREAMRLDSSPQGHHLAPVLRMNSTLSKIHAVYAGDGLCMYESRVAVAMATLVELWRRDSGRASAPLPQPLTFPSVGAQLHRRVRHFFPEAADPGTLSYVGLLETATATRWADAALRLSQLVKEVLRRVDPGLFVASPQITASGAPAARAAVFNAALFMVGYDAASLTRGTRQAQDGASPSVA